MRPIADMEIEKVKNLDRESLRELSQLPNVGKTIASYLLLIGIDLPKKLIGKNPYELYEAICKQKGRNMDLCLLDVFISVVYFMEGGAPLPWWDFTAKRKKHLSMAQKKTESSRG